MGTYGHAEVFAAAAAGASQSGFDGRSFAEELRRGLLPHAADRQSPGALAARLAHAAGIGGPVLASMTACAGGTQAIGDAFRWVRRGEADVVLAGASDSEIYPMGLASFCLLGALSRRNDEPARASRPFDAERDGFVLGEGAGFVVLEERERALARGASVLAEVAGFGSACDAFRVTDPHPEGLGAVLAMRRALDDAGLSPGDVGYVNAHGTSTPGGDRVEARALGEVFGARLAGVAVSSTKSMIGHLTVAAGAVEAIVTALSLRDGLVHPTLNQESPDPECAIDTVPEGARRVDLQRGAVELLRVRRADGLPGVRAGVKIRLSPPRPVARTLGRLYGALHGTLRLETAPPGRVAGVARRLPVRTGGLRVLREGRLRRRRDPRLRAVHDARRARPRRRLGDRGRGGARGPGRPGRDGTGRRAGARTPPPGPARRRRASRPRRRRAARPVGSREGRRRRLRGPDGPAAPPRGGGGPDGVRRPAELVEGLAPAPLLARRRRHRRAPPGAGRPRPRGARARSPAS